jgi:hypothetical protein
VLVQSLPILAERSGERLRNSAKAGGVKAVISRSTPCRLCIARPQAPLSYSKHPPPCWSPYCCRRLHAGQRRAISGVPTRRTVNCSSLACRLVALSDEYCSASECPFFEAYRKSLGRAAQKTKLARKHTERANFLAAGTSMRAPIFHGTASRRPAQRAQRRAGPD